MISSLLLGLIFGGAISFFTNSMRNDKYRIWRRRREHELVIVLFLGNYLCYLVAELVEVSSIFSIFVCGVVSGHYAKFNLKPKTRLYAGPVFKVHFSTLDGILRERRRAPGVRH